MTRLHKTTLSLQRQNTGPWLHNNILTTSETVIKIFHNSDGGSPIAYHRRLCYCGQQAFLLTGDVLNGATLKRCLLLTEFLACSHTFTIGHDAVVMLYDSPCDPCVPLVQLYKIKIQRNWRMSQSN